MVQSLNFISLCPDGGEGWNGEGEFLSDTRESNMLKHNMKMLCGDFNVKIDKEPNLKPTIDQTPSPRVIE